MKTMKDFKGTPGEFTENWERVFAGSFRIASFEGFSPTEAKANAKLFAASKKLLRESIRYFEILKDLEDNYPETWARITQGTGIATTNGLEQAINEAL